MNYMSSLKRTIKTPKLYFYDTGLIRYLTKWSSPEVAKSGAFAFCIKKHWTCGKRCGMYLCCKKEVQCTLRLYLTKILHTIN